MTFPVDTGELMQTYMGVAFNLRHPTPDMVNIQDIAHHLATLNRFTGALAEPVSIAQHAVLVSFLAPPVEAYGGLHHDSHEAYTNDLSSPMKRSLKHKGDREYQTLALNIQLAIDARFRVDTHTDAIKRADLVALRLEATAGFMQHPDWITDYPEPTQAERERVPVWLLAPLGWREAKHLFLSRSEELRVLRGDLL